MFDALFDQPDFRRANLLTGQRAARPLNYVQVRTVKSVSVWGRVSIYEAPRHRNLGFGERNRAGLRRRACARISSPFFSLARIAASLRLCWATQMSNSKSTAATSMAFLGQTAVDSSGIGFVWLGGNNSGGFESGVSAGEDVGRSALVRFGELLEGVVAAGHEVANHEQRPALSKDIEKDTHRAARAAFGMGLASHVDDVSSSHPLGLSLRNSRAPPELGRYESEEHESTFGLISWVPYSYVASPSRAAARASVALPECP